MTNLTYISPCFIVENLRTSVAFYIDKPGFEVRYMPPDDNPFFAIAGRDKISIFLKTIAVDVKPVPNHTRHEWAGVDAYISAADPDTLYEEYHSRYVKFRKHLGVDDDKLRGFKIEDADGYVLFFGRPGYENQ